MSISKQLAKKRRHQGQLKLGQRHKLTQLDERFWAISLFTDLKLFQHYSKVVQWIGNKQKAMVKQLIVVAMPLLIHSAPKAIQCAQAILDFIILAQYVLYNDETLCYMEHVFYRLENTKIAIKHHRSIDSKLYRPTLNYLKFHAISYFVQCICDYGSVVNYNTAYSKVVYKYLVKVFHNRINKKEYDS